MRNPFRDSAQWFEDQLRRDRLLVFRYYFSMEKRHWESAKKRKLFFRVNLAGFVVMVLALLVSATSGFADSRDYFRAGVYLVVSICFGYNALVSNPRNV